KRQPSVKIFFLNCNFVVFLPNHVSIAHTRCFDFLFGIGSPCLCSDATTEAKTRRTCRFFTDRRSRNRQEARSQSKHNRCTRDGDGFPIVFARAFFWKLDAYATGASRSSSLDHQFW